ncbi:MAG: hypothetical protein HWE30_15415 [Methylocystaceae bacterium]|nr:hypothetical protein [Methylocystaceae bacterium]
MKWIEVVQSMWQTITLTEDIQEDVSKDTLTRNYVVKNAEVKTSEDASTEEIHTLEAFSSGKGMLFANGYENVTVLFGGNEKSHIELNGVKNALVRTYSGDDYIEINPSPESKDQSFLQIFTHAGNDMVILNSILNADTHYKIKTGPGDDRIFSRGRSKEVLDGGEGDDYFEPGVGNDVVLGGPGYDEVRFIDNLSDYRVKELANGRVEVSNDNEMKTLVDVELLTFKDTYLNFDHLMLDNDSAMAVRQSFSGSYSFAPDYSFGDGLAIDRPVFLQELQNFFKSRYVAYQTEFNTSDEKPKETDDGNSFQNEHVEAISTALFNLEDVLGTVFDEFPENEEVEEEEDQEIGLQNHSPPAGEDTLDVILNHLPDDSPIDMITIEGEIINSGHCKGYLFGSWESDLIIGGDDQDNLFGWTGDDVLVGGAGNDWMEGGLGDDLIIGGTGHDTAFYLGWADSYVYDQENGTLTDLFGMYGMDTLVSVERLQFIDGTYEITDKGVEKISSGFGWGWQSGLHVTGDAPLESDRESNSYQLHVSYDGKQHHIEIDI